MSTTESIISTTEEFIPPATEEFIPPATESKSILAIDTLELLPYDMSDKEINLMKPYALKTPTPLMKALSESQRMFVTRDYISFMTVSTNPTYQVDAFVAKYMAELLYNVQY